MLPSLMCSIVFACWCFASSDVLGNFCSGGFLDTITVEWHAGGSLLPYQAPDCAALRRA